jgi:hypothetical protein
MNQTLSHIFRAVIFNNPDHSPPSNSAVKNVWMYTSAPTTPPWRGVQLVKKNRDNFTFIFYRLTLSFLTSEVPTPPPCLRNGDYKIYISNFLISMVSFVFDFQIT